MRRHPTAHNLHPEEVAAGVPQGSIRISGGGSPSDPLTTARRVCVRKGGFELVSRACLGRLERHWTADEMRDAAAMAASISEDELSRQEGIAPLANLDPEARAAAWSRARNAAKTRHLERGVAGLPPFAKLPYFRYECAWVDWSHDCVHVLDLRRCTVLSIIPYWLHLLESEDLYSRADTKTFSILPWLIYSCTDS